MCSELGRDPAWEEEGLRETGDDGLVGVEGGRGEMGEEEVMLSASTEAALRTTGGEGVWELSGSYVQSMII